VSDANTNVERNEQLDASAKQGFGVPLFGIPGIFGGFAEQGAVRARERLDNMKLASGEIAQALREVYSTNAKGAADYGIKVIEFSNANANAALDFLSHLAGTKSLSDLINLSATHGRQNIEVASAQNRELWELARKVATETAEPIKKSFAKAFKA